MNHFNLLSLLPVLVLIGVLGHLAWNRSARRPG
jgi:hypothetical protein